MTLHYDLVRLRTKRDLRPLGFEHFGRVRRESYDRREGYCQVWKPEGWNSSQVKRSTFNKQRKRLNERIFPMGWHRKQSHSRNMGERLPALPVTTSLVMPGRHVAASRSWKYCRRAIMVKSASALVEDDYTRKVTVVRRVFIERQRKFWEPEPKSTKTCHIILISRLLNDSRSHMSNLGSQKQSRLLRDASVS